MQASAARDLSLVCPVCGVFDMPSDVGRQPLPPHLDPVTGSICPERVGLVMLRRVQVGE